MSELRAGLGTYFTFYNGERPHQSLGNRTPMEVYVSREGGGAKIIDRFSSDSTHADTNSDRVVSTFS